MESSRNIMIKDSVFDPLSTNSEQKVLYYRGSDSRIRYKVWIYLEGNDIFFVDYVIYNLHHTFQQPQRTVQRNITNQNCALIIWSWGVFEVKVKIFFKTGEIIEAFHYLTYDKQLKKPGLNLVNTGSFSE